MTLMVADVSVWNEPMAWPVEVVPSACPLMATGRRKWPVNAASSAGVVRTVVCGAELLVTAGPLRFC